MINKIILLNKKLREGWDIFFLKYCKEIDVDLEFLDCDIGDWCD